MSCSASLPWPARDVLVWVQVLQVKDIGAIVELPGGKDALVHISELSMEPVESVAATVKVGDEIDVMITGCSGNSTRASVAAIERVAKGLPMVEKRTRRRPEDSSGGRGRGGRGRGRGRDDRGGRGRGEARTSSLPLSGPPTPRQSSASGGGYKLDTKLDASLSDTASSSGSSGSAAAVDSAADSSSST